MTVWEAAYLQLWHWGDGDNGEAFVGGQWHRVRRVHPAGLDWYRITFWNYPVVIMHGSQSLEWRKNGNG